jgi:adenosylhomocysteine nucleosidase
MAPRVLLVAALAIERRALQASLRAPSACQLGGRPAVRGRLGDTDVLLVQAGVGRDRARATVLEAARTCDVGAAWSLGLAGGLVDGLRPGDLVYPAVALEDAESTEPPLRGDSAHEAVCAAMRRAALPVVPGAVVTVRAPLRTSEAKRAAARRYGAVACDMEAAGVARAARTLGIPWTALKAVVDAVDEPLPSSLDRCTSPEGDVRWRGLLACAFEGRQFWRSVRRLGSASRLATDRLRRGLEAAFRVWAALTPL